MFEDLFTKPGAIASYWAAPLLEERLSYLSHCAQAGARPSTLRYIAAHQTNLIHLLDFREGDRVSVARIESAARRWSRPGGRRCSQVAKPEACRRFVGHAVRWLRFVNLLEEPNGTRHSHAGEVAAFAEWMRHERGWTEDTIRGCCNTVDRFFCRLDERGVSLALVGIADIDRAVARWHARDCSRVTIHDYAQRLRTFFRFAERQSWCAAGLAEGILPPRFHRGETLPKGLNRDEVLRLLATTEGDRAADVRDRAILMVLIAYGLRAGEVAGLRLEDLDWERERLQVRRPKPGRTHHYPFSRGVGQAILRYLRELRPRRPDRALFFTLNAPIRPLSGKAISHVVRSRLDRLGIVGKRRGAHSLRHAAAQHLLDHGLSMKKVGDYLGHRSVSATSAYAKVRLGTLREVADIDLGGADMILRDAIDRYIAWRQDHGARFNTTGHMLRRFCKHFGEHIRCDVVTEADVLRYLVGNGPLTRYRANKYSALTGFYRYAISRGYAERSPLPAPESEPRTPFSAPPYVFTHDELQRLFGAIDISRQRAVQLDADTLRALLLLLYGAGLRFGEAQRLTIHDVDIHDAVLTVRDTKFHKTRLVPVGPQLANVLRDYAIKRSQRPLPMGMDSTFIANLNGTPLCKGTVRPAFAKLLRMAGIRHEKNDGRQSPCFHSLRHTAAVHRLIAWYRQGTDVQRLLPALSTWLGHAHLDGTQVYLSMTSELLHEASVRFDDYVNGEDHE